jgi:hypothetical protein
MFAIAAGYWREEFSVRFIFYHPPSGSLPPDNQDQRRVLARPLHREVWSEDSFSNVECQRNQFQKREVKRGAARF